MGEKVITISFSELEKDMITAKDVNHNGKALLKKDMIINEQMIKRLQRLLLVGNVEIYNPEILKEELTLEQKKIKEFEKVENDFKEISLKLQRTFRSIQNENSECMNEIRQFAQKIQDELKPSSVVIKNIVLHGSGNDVIYRHGVNVAALSALIGKWIGTTLLPNLSVISATTFSKSALS